MAENKTQPTTASVDAFIEAVPNARRRADAKELLALMSELTGEPAVMWGPSIIGFGRYHYRYASGREGDMPRIGFSPRKANLVLYILPGFGDFSALLARLGKVKTSVSCLYVNSLDDVDREVLRALMVESLAVMAERFPSEG